MRRLVSIFGTSCQDSAKPIIVDVTDLMQVEAAFAEAIRLMDGVDVLVNNAGISIRINFSTSLRRSGKKSSP